jgi:peptide-methionine (R)-S-oxide reductase
MLRLHVDAYGLPATQQSVQRGSRDRHGSRRKVHTAWFPGFGGDPGRRPSRALYTSRVPKVAKPEAEWRKQLSPLGFAVTRHGETEYAFSDAYWNLHEKGLFRCVCCDTVLFSSKEKFDSGTGWPNFWQPIAPQNVGGRNGKAAGPTDTEVTCQRCDAHLGDLFDDGPRPTGLRYCIDSVALRFVKSA